MAKQFEIKAIRAQDLINIFGSLTPQEIAKLKPEEAVKSISKVQKIYEEMEKCNEEFGKLAEKYFEPQIKLREDVQEKIRQIRSDKTNTEEDKKNKIELLMLDVNDQLILLSKKQEEKLNYTKEGENIVKIKIDSDERFSLLKELFEKIAAEKFLSRKALMECWEAIESAKEA